MDTTTPTVRTWAIGSPKDLGRALSGVRRARRLTQQQLADMTGIDRTYLAKLETGSETIELQRLVLALRRLGAEVTVTLPKGEDASEG
jgi:transcriptional regulator with XRE-family HTH domain